MRILLSFIVPATLLPAALAAQTLHPVERDGKWGFIDSTGTIVIQLQFDLVLDFDSDNVSAPVPSDGAWGLIDRQGAWKAKPRYDEVYVNTTDGSLRTLVGTKWVPIDRNGKLRRDEESEEKEYAIAMQESLWEASGMDSDSRSQSKKSRTDGGADSLSATSRTTNSVTDAG